MLDKSKVKYIQSLSHKKLRDQEGVFIAEGPKIINEFLQSENISIVEIFGTQEWFTDSGIYRNSKLMLEIKVTGINEIELERISQLTTPNQVLAIVKKIDIGENITTKNKIVLALDTIQDPGNLGTIIRTADWFGVDQIVCSKNCADIYNPKVVQATMGSIARVKVFYTDLEEWLGAQKNINIYATGLEGQNISSMKKIKEGVIIIGNESKGISDEILKLANIKITIQKKGKAESLNAAVAAGVVLGYFV